MTAISIYDHNGAQLNARIDVEDDHIVLHSHSGNKVTGSNPDYRLALPLIIERLRNNSIDFVSYLDSEAARRARPDMLDRVLLTSVELDPDNDKAAMQIIRKSNEGSKSHGAWRRLLFLAEGFPEHALIDAVTGCGKILPPISTGDYAKVQRAHIKAAIEEIRQGRERANRFAEGRDYCLIVGDGGEPLPPKKVFGLALANALNRPISPEHFSSGDRIFKILRDRGFEVVERVKTSHLEEEPAQFERDDIEPLLPSDEELVALEGSKKLRLHFKTERSGALPKRYKQKFKDQNGKLICFRCAKDYIAEYGAEMADACFDVHHIEMVSEREESSITGMDDLQLLCSNCHRVTHREMRAGPTPTKTLPR